MKNLVILEKNLIGEPPISPILVPFWDPGIEPNIKEPVICTERLLMSDHRYIQLVGTNSKTRSEPARECPHWNENEKIWRSDDEPIDKVIFNRTDVRTGDSWSSRTNEMKAD